MVGISLGFLGLRLTRFEVTPTGQFYTPGAHAWVLRFLSSFVCRIAWRFVAGGYPGASAAASSGPPGGSLTPLTLLLVGMLAGYYTHDLRCRAVALVARSGDLVPSEGPGPGGP